MNSLDYQVYKGLGKSYLQDAKNSVKNLISKPIRTLTLAAMLGVYACSGSGGGGSDNNGGGGQTYECNNNQDDDGDTLVDMLDPGCSSSTDDDEYNAPGNQAPVAVASFVYSNPDNGYHPAYVHPGNVSAFNGSNSYDPDNSPNPELTYFWTLLTMPGCSNLTSGDIMPDRVASLVGLTPDCVGNYTLKLDVNDGADTGSDTIDLLVQDNNAPATPNISPADNPAAWEGNPIDFTASGSTDSDGVVVAYEIINSNLPNDPDISFNQNTGVFNWPTDCNDSGSYTLDVIARDDDNATSVPHTVTINVWENPTCSVPTN